MINEIQTLEGNSTCALVPLPLRQKVVGLKNSQLSKTMYISLNALLQFTIVFIEYSSAKYKNVRKP